MTEPWHVPSEQLAGYLDDRVDQPTASSIEAHLIRCVRCRDDLAARSDATAVAGSWAAVERAIDGEYATRTQRVAGRVGVGDRELRTLAPTMSLQAAWLAATFLALLAAAVIARQSGDPGAGLALVAFLTITPLAPLAAVVAAISAASEPASEIARTTPASRLRIGATRAATVLGAAIVLGLVASAALPGDWADAVVWLLPALALSGAGALLAGRAAPAAVIGWLGAIWVTTVVTAARVTDDRLAAFRPGAQAVYLALAALAAGAIAVRPHSLDLRSRT